LAGHEAPARVVLCRLPAAPVELEVASGVGGDLALIASVGAELRGLARELESDGRVSCSVIVRFSMDPAQDLAALAETLGADVVLAGPGPDGDARTRYAAPLPRPAGSVGVRVRLGDGSARSTTVAIADGAAGGRTALRVGAQVALARGGDLLIACTDNRRAARQAAAAVESLRGRGLAVVAANEDAARVADVLVTSDTDGLPTGLAERATVFCVQPDDADRDDELEQSLARIRVDTAGQRRS
ncbi:MAG: hypothetical protein QOI50_3303, partial [Pseudonocardiales bacterium]|nr:hypothetical protein [Pseudonocardiales bacterium]